MTSVVDVISVLDDLKKELNAVQDMLNAYELARAGVDSLEVPYYDFTHSGRMSVKRLDDSYSFTEALDRMGDELDNARKELAHYKSRIEGVYDTVEECDYDLEVEERSWLQYCKDCRNGV